MRDFPKPRVVVSRCLGFATCRYDGSVIPDAVVAALSPHVEFIPVCPEVEIGLGIPRSPIRLVRDDPVRLVQPDTGLDLTARMAAFAQAFLGSLADVDGFILKNRSPSCALRDAKIHASEAGPAVGRGPGLFGAAVRMHFPNLPAEDEGRLTNRPLREHFFTALFALARLRRVEGSGDLGELVRFHTHHKFLLMAQGQTKLWELGRMVANREGLAPQEVIHSYGEKFREAFLRPPRRPAVINVLEHAFGYVSQGLSPEERRFFLNLLQEFRAGRVPASVPREVLRAWVIRFEVGYLAEQVFFEPFPAELLLPLDSGKGSE
ncbi:MAG: YbgA family protein [Candidatus Bipolaricaulaceae bacterium]